MDAARKAALFDRVDARRLRTPGPVVDNPGQAPEALALLVAFQPATDGVNEAHAVETTPLVG
jgi:hypothetical protein